MIKEVYQRLFKNVSFLLSDNNILIYSKDTPVLINYLEKASVDVLKTFDISSLTKYSLIIIDPSMDLSGLSRDVLETFINTSKPVILPYIDIIHKYKKDLNFYIYDIYQYSKQEHFITIRQIKNCQSYLNFYIKFQENNHLQRFLDNDQATNFMELLYTVIKDFYDIKARLVYPFSHGGHSGTFILGESHSNHHSYPEKGEVYININSCSNKNPIPLIKQALIDMFKLDSKYIYIDYKEVDVHF